MDDSLGDSPDSSSLARTAPGGRATSTSQRAMPPKTDASRHTSLPAPAPKRQRKRDQEPEIKEEGENPVECRTCEILLLPEVSVKNKYCSIACHAQWRLKKRAEPRAPLPRELYMNTNPRDESLVVGHRKPTWYSIPLSIRNKIVHSDELFIREEWHDQHGPHVSEEVRLMRNSFQFTPLLYPRYSWFDLVSKEEAMKAPK